MTWYHYCIKASIEIYADSRDEADKIAKGIENEFWNHKIEGTIYEMDGYCFNCGPEKKRLI